jgi:hypothetical protein
MSRQHVEDRVRLAADDDRALHVTPGERTQGGEHALPPRTPLGEHLVAGHPHRVVELAVAIAPRLLAIGVQEVGEPRAHVPRQVPHQHDQVVRFLVEPVREGVVVEDLRHRVPAHRLEPAQFGEQDDEHVRHGVLVHDAFLPTRPRRSAPTGRRRRTTTVGRMVA